MRLTMFLFALLVYSFLPSATSVEYPIVKTNYGPVRGYSFTGAEGTEAQIFKKIPFASAPVGDLRWRKPALPQPWNSTIDGTFFGPACAQKTAVDKGPVTGFSEDCLYVNVYTSQRCRESNASCLVLFVVHGGVGIYGSPMKFTDKALVRNFVSQDIIVVTTAYRLGAFGAMALGDENVLPSNLGTHDILAALKFTRSEIGNFGGNKERVTLLGHSSGGHYVLSIAFSPGITKPGEPRLFQNVIIMSGGSGMSRLEQTVYRSHKVAKQLKCEGSASEIMACLRLLDTVTIADAAFKVHGENVLSAKGPYGTTMSGELFPITSALEMRQSNEPVRLMIGTTLYELPGPSGKYEVNRVLGIVNNDECYEKYLRDVLSGEFEPGYNEASQDIIMTAHLYSKYTAEIGGEAYLYEYDNPDNGAHTDDVFLVLGNHAYEMDDNQKWLSRVYPQYFVNFIKGKKPTPDWNPVTPNLMNYYSVNRNITEDVYPHTKFGYQSNIVKYYNGIVQYDYKLLTVKNKLLTDPVQYKSLNFNGDFQDFWESLTFVDALIFFCFLIGAISLLCCLCKCCAGCFYAICCCGCCRRNECEHEPLVMYQYR